MDLSDERREVLSELADSLTDTYSCYGRAARYYKQLCGEIAMQREAPPRLDFLLNVGVAAQRMRPSGLLHW